MVALAVFGVKKYYAKVKFWIGSHSNYDDLISRMWRRTWQHPLVNYESIQLE
jgi:hypothetical protein